MTRLFPELTRPHRKVVDNLELYPEWLWKPAGSPLHFAYGVKQDYIAEFNDPIPQWSAATASGHDSWMGLFCHLEVIFALPNCQDHDRRKQHFLEFFHS